ncbi:MAG: hypothetical protein IPO81_22735 [Kouleothrix sp.]|nr:hypothetical protein [Kouleothrix sp.]
MAMALYGLYSDEQMAKEIEAKLVAAGVKRRGIQILTLPANEIEHGQIGSFAEGSAHMHDSARDHVGSFAEGDSHMHDAARDHVGSFAEGDSHMHDAARDHVGSFASHLHADDMLRDLIAAGMSSDDAQACVMRMMDGGALLLVRPGADRMDEATAILRSA